MLIFFCLVGWLVVFFVIVVVAHLHRHSITKHHLRHRQASISPVLRWFFFFFFFFFFVQIVRHVLVVLAGCCMCSSECVRLIL